MLVRIADMTADIRPRYRYTAELCRPYLAPEGAQADFTVCVSEAACDREAEPGAEHPRSYLESLAIYRRLCHEALRYDTFLFHGSALALDGEAYLFSAPSGTGKSTHAALWRQVWGERVTMVNDDKPMLKVRADGVWVCGTPWDGKHHLSTPGMFPLRAVCFLERGGENICRPMSTAEAYPRLLGQTYRPDDPADMQATLTLLDRAVPHLKFYLLTCNMEPEAAEVACRAMREERA